MEMYQDMEKANEISDAHFKNWQKQNPTLPKWEYPSFRNEKYSDTMLHNVITIINKLNNR